MGADVQLAVVAVVVGLAGLSVARAAWKAWAGKKVGCGSGCGKCAAAAPPATGNRISLPQL